MNDNHNLGKLDDWKYNYLRTNYFKCEQIDAEFYTIQYEPLLINILLVNPDNQDVIAIAEWSPRDPMTIKALYVATKYRGLGHSKKFIEWCIRVIHINHLDIIYTNTPAILLCQKCGFKISGFADDARHLIRMTF